MKTPYELHQIKQAALWAKLSKIQDACSHPAEYLTINSYYAGDRYEDGFNIHHKCSYCGKHWVENQ